MGIKNLFKLIRDVCPGVIQNTHISEFEFKKIGVDVSLYMYKYKVVSGDNFISSIISLLLSMKRYRVHPIMIFDGKAPVEKSEERKKRASARDKLITKGVELRKSIDAYHATGEVNSVLIDAVKFEAKSDQKLLRDWIPSSAVKINIRAAEDRCRKIESQVVTITKEDVVLIKNACDIMKIQYICAPGEAEAFCSSMCRRGGMSGVLTDDSDVLTYKCPVMLRNYNINTGMCESVHYDDVLDGLNLTPDKFTDLCIMCGTDYNPNIPKIGSKTAYKLIQVYDSIDAIEPIQNRIQILNHKRVRQIFTTFDGKNDIIKEYDTRWNGTRSDIDIERFIYFITINNCRELSSVFEQSYAHDDIIEVVNSQSTE